MEKRITVLGIVVENPESVGQLNALLHDYSADIMGRMGIPMREHGVNLISVAMCAPMNTISTLSGKLGRLEGVSAKVTYSSVAVDE